MAIKLVMVQADIDNANAALRSGEGSLSQCCPIAQVARRYWKSGTVSVGPDRLTYFPETSIDSRDYRLPLKAQNFIVIWDGDGEVEPISFWIYPTDKR